MRIELPTVFVHGPAAPIDVLYVEDLLRDALAKAGAVRYSALWIDAAASPDVTVEVEVDLDGGPIGSRAVGATVRSAGDACVDAVRRQLSPTFTAST